MDYHREDSSNGRRIKMDRSESNSDYKKKTPQRQSVVEDVNQKADDIINNFRQQLKSEREEILKRRREAIA